MAMSKVVRAVGSASASSLGPAASVRKAVNKIDTSGLTLLEVVLTLSVLFGLFLALLLVGELCKIFNKPKAEATPYTTSSTTPKLYQPSAAGYGTRVAGLKAPEGNAAYSSRVSLLGGASPMGRGGSQDDSRDSPYGTPNSQHSNGRDYFGRAGHTRGQSSGIQLPGATASAARRGGPSHPPVQGTSMAPDGSGFQVGQVVKKGPTTPDGYGPKGYNNTSPSGARGGQQHRATPSKVGLGPPPATDARRRSRYARNDSRRIDSIGPGAVRKSMFMTDEGNAAMPAMEGGPRLGGNLRRIDSVGKGDHRRKSTYNFDKRGAGLSIYANGEGNMDYGSGDPLGAKPLVSPGAGPLGNAMPPLQRQPSPSGLPLPTDMGKAPTIGKPLQQQMQPQQSQYYQQPPPQQAAGAYAAQGYPGGGMPRMPANPGYAPMRANYERGARQVV